MQKRNPRFFYGYIVLAAVWIIYFCNMGFSTYGAPAINPVMVSELGLNSGILGVAISLCTLMQGVAGPITGRWISRSGVRAPYLVGTLLILSATVILGLFVKTQVGFVLTYGLLMGFGMGFGGILTAQSAVNNWFNKKKSFAMSMVLSAGAIGGFIAPQVIKGIVTDKGWNFGWLFVAGTCCISLVLVLFVLKDSPADIGQYPDGDAQGAVEKPVAAKPTLTFSDACQDKAIYGIIINYVTRTALYYSFTGHIIMYLTSFQVEYSAAVYVLSILSVTSLIGRLLIGVIPERFLKPSTALGLGSIMMAGGMFVVNTLASVSVIYLGAIVFGFGFGISHVALPLVVSRFYGAENFALINGSMTPINYVIGALGPLVVGIFAEKVGSYAIPFQLLSILALAGGILTLAIRQPDLAKLRRRSATRRGDCGESA